MNCCCKAFSQKHSTEYSEWVQRQIINGITSDKVTSDVRISTHKATLPNRVTQYYITYSQRNKAFLKVGESMVLLSYCKTSNKGRIAVGYMQTLITHIHCVCFLVEVSDYRSHTSILLCVFLSYSHFRLSALFKPSYMKL